MNFRNLKMAAILAAVFVSICFAYRSPADWERSINDYKGDYKTGQGDTVKYGEYNGKPLYWWAKFGADTLTPPPGDFADEGGTSPWVLINSLSAATSGGRPNFTAVTWNGGNGSTAISSIGSMQAKVPTWRDAANGAYTITLDDIGAMPFEKSVKPALDIWEENPGQYDNIRMSWGVYVSKMDDNQWGKALEMVTKGHEMFSHSIDHTSAADQWSITYPGKVISQTDPAIPGEVRGLKVVGTWKVTATSAQGVTQPTLDFGPSWTGTLPDEATIKNTVGKIGNPVNHSINNASYWVDGAPGGGHPFTIKAESEMVTVEWPAYWTGYDPSTSVKWDDPRIKITAKPGVDSVTLATGQKVYVKYDEGYPVPTTEYEGHQEGLIAATGVQWFDLGLLLSDYPHYYNGAQIHTNWNGSCATNGCDVSSQAGWQVSTRDEGRPGFVAKVFCIKGWDGGKGERGKQTLRNFDTANIIINKNIYENITTAGEYFAKGKRNEYFGYPFDAYSEKTHANLQAVSGDAGWFVGARGGAKSGKPMSGDFYHPYRIDFDAFYINNKAWTTPTSDQAEFLVPNNAHVLLGLNAMADSIVKYNGYMVRELHAVADLPGNSWYEVEGSDDPENADAWAINNSGQSKGGWWGGITKQFLKDHFDYLNTLIDANKLTVFTPSEAVKYRMTANAFQTDASLAAEGDNWKVTLNLKSGENVTEHYQEEISVIVNLGEAVTKLAVAYDGNPSNTSADNSPRRKPRQMDSEGKIWSVSINPFATNDHSALLIRDGEWFGQDVDFEYPDSYEKPSGSTSISKKLSANKNIAFTGIANGQINLRLTAGNYTASLYNLQGRLVGMQNFTAVNGVNATGLKTNNLAKGMLILKVKDAKGASVLQNKIMIK